MTVCTDWGAGSGCLFVTGYLSVTFLGMIREVRNVQLVRVLGVVRGTDIVGAHPAGIGNSLPGS